MPERFTETLRTASESSWSHAVEHRFVQELEHTHGMKTVASEPDRYLSGTIARFVDEFRLDRLPNTVIAIARQHLVLCRKRSASAMMREYRPMAAPFAERGLADPS